MFRIFGALASPLFFLLFISVPEDKALFLILLVLSIVLAAYSPKTIEFKEETQEPGRSLPREEKSENSESAAKWARHVLSNPEKFVILDTETTGVSKTAEIIQIGIMDIFGSVLLNSFVRPTKRKSIPSGATKVNGITMSMLKSAPTYPEIYEKIQEIVSGKTIIAYNAEFDERLIDQTAEKNGGKVVRGEWHCCMKEYARFKGIWNNYRNDYKWHKLPGAKHGAIEDCHAVLKLLKKMAA